MFTYVWNSYRPLNKKLLMIQCCKYNVNAHQLPKPKLRFDERSRNIGPFGWLLLVVPTTTFALGTWQVRRKQWKEQLIADLLKRKHAQPIQLPHNYEDELRHLEYYPIHVRGRFLHDREMYLGPRSLLLKGDAFTEGGLMSKQNTSQGYLVVTPFQLEDRDVRILINRGWVSSRQKNPSTRPAGQSERTVDLIGLVRLHENRPLFMPQHTNATDDSCWFYRDVQQMALHSGAATVWLDATDEVEGAAAGGGPIPGQTRVVLRNEHLSYVLTWYGLSVATAFLWYRHFLLRR